MSNLRKWQKQNIQVLGFSDGEGLIGLYWNCGLLPLVLVFTKFDVGELDNGKVFTGFVVGGLYLGGEADSG